VAKNEALDQFRQITGERPTEIQNGCRCFVSAINGWDDAELSDEAFFKRSFLARNHPSHDDWLGDSDRNTAGPHEYLAEFILANRESGRNG
jgi:hypothetical protein